ncbi:MAG TPA: MarR family transcriptional regulator [Acidimicrobiia bacterium]|jgi:DNA-binding MarR family transcriptional regulator
MIVRNDREIHDLAQSLRVSVGVLVRRLRQQQADGELTMPESSALARLERSGPATSAALARLEQISPQSMGATLAALEARGLVERSRDEHDGRCVVMSVTRVGSKQLWNRRNARTQLIARKLSEEFTPAEIRHLMAAAPLLERLAEQI